MSESTAPMLESRQRDDLGGVRLLVFAREKTAKVPGLDLPGLDVVATAASYGVDAHEAHTVDEVAELVRAGIADRDRPTLINAPTVPVGV